MLNKNQSINVNGRSTITVDNKEVVVMTMSATIGESGAVNISKNIQYKNTYLENKETVDADAAAFETYVYSLMEV